MDQNILNHRRLINENLIKSFVGGEEIIEKGLKAKVGEVRIWKGKKYIKEDDGVWREIMKDGKVSQQGDIKFSTSKNKIPIPNVGAGKKSNDTFKSLKDFFRKHVFGGEIFKGDEVFIKNAIKSAKLDDNQLIEIANSIKKHNKFFEKMGGIPFPGDDEEYDKLLKKDKGIANMQKIAGYLDN